MSGSGASGLKTNKQTIDNMLGRIYFSCQVKIVDDEDTQKKEARRLTLEGGGTI